MDARRILLTGIGALLCWAGMANGAAPGEPKPAGRSLQLADLHRIAEVSEPRLSPDGEWVAYVRTQHNLDKDISQSRIWLVRYDGSQHRPLNAVPASADTESQRAPAWGAEGQLFYLSDQDERGEQVWRQSIGGGEAARVTEFPAGVAEFAVSPDGRQIAVIAADPPQEWPAAGKGKTAAPLITERFQFMEGDVGEYLDARRKHLHRVEVASGETRQLVQGAHDELLPAWSPDGQWIAYVSKRGDDPDRHSNFDLFMIAADGKDVERQITDFPGPDLDPYWGARPAWSPDGSHILFLRGGEPRLAGYAPAELAVVNVRTGSVSLPARADRFHYHPHWSQDGSAIYALREGAEATHLIRVELATGAVRYLTSGPRFDASVEVGKGDRVVLLGNDARAPAELFALEQELRPLSRVNDDWLAQALVPAFEALRVNAADGAEIHALLLRPAGYEPGRAYPTVVRLHGGPVYQFSHEFHFEMQWYAAQGYAVLAVNPRGSSGRGLEFSQAIFADWGNLDVKDVLAAVDHVIKLGIADPQQLVVGGHSYGGYLTNYVVASDARFKAAFSSSGASNSLGLYGTDQYVRDYENELGTPWANPAAWQRVSYPFFKADRIRTPTLFLCSADDFNVPCLGSQQMYQALRSLKVPTRLIRFPDQGHALSIPSYLAFRLQTYLEWFNRFIGR